MRVFVHDARQQILVEAAPVDADAHRLVVAAGHFDHLRELLVAFCALADIARIDAELGQRLRRTPGTSVSSLWPLKWKSPISGTSSPIGRRRSRIFGTARGRFAAY